MPNIHVQCDQCGDNRLTPADLAIRINSHTNQATYTFRCLHCQMFTIRECNGRTAELLVGAGVTFTTWTPPVPAQVEGPPISHDDLLDFHDAITAIDELTVEAFQPNP